MGISGPGSDFRDCDFRDRDRDHVFPVWNFADRDFTIPIPDRNPRWMDGWVDCRAE
jgi:hypothetical protein